MMFQSVDTVVVGGGLAGCAAAIAAARTGAKTVLVESAGILGGQATLGLVTPLSATRTCKGISFGGICQEIDREARKLTRELCAPSDHRPVDYALSPHATKYLLLKKCVESGVTVLFHTTLAFVQKEDGKILSATFLTKSGFREIAAKTFIDATGDGDLIALSDDRFLLGSEREAYEMLASEKLDLVHEETDEKAKVAEKTLQPVSIFFRMRGVDVERALPLNNKVLTYENLSIDRTAFEKEEFFGSCGFEENGDRVPMPQGRVLITRGTSPDAAVVNMSRVIGIDGSDADSLNQGEVLAQQQVFALLFFLRKYIPGFENAYLEESAATLGVRETRRLQGRYILTAKDVITCTRFEDAVACGSYIVDIHDPLGKSKAIGGAIKGDFYDIPLRSLKSATYDNLYAAGRCISADHVAHSSTRIQGTCLLTGQAAGTAAALQSLGKDATAQGVRKKLIEDGVNLEL